jgi:hypothetical protein
MKEIIVISIICMLPHLAAWTIYRREWRRHPVVIAALNSGPLFSGKEIIAMVKAALKDDGARVRVYRP